jgi:hypothetical protein
MANGILGAIINPAQADIAGGIRQFEQQQQRNLLFQQQQEELVRQQQAKGLAGAVLGQQLPGQLGELAQVDPAAAQQVFDVLQVQGQARQQQFANDVRVASQLPPDQAFTFVQQRVAENEAQGIASPNMREFLGELQQDPEQAMSNLQQLNQAIQLSSPEARELGLRERGLELREREIEQRVLDREAANAARREGLELRKQESEIRQQQAQLQRETNELKRQQLESEIASAQRATQFEATNAVDNIQASISTIDRLLEGEGLEAAAGISAAFPTIPGTQAANFEAELESLQSQAFLAEVEKMKGLGALTEAEGRKLTSAIGALNLSMSDKALRASLNRIRSTMERAKQKVQRKFNVEAGLQPEAAEQPTTAQPRTIGRFTIEVE